MSFTFTLHTEYTVVANSIVGVVVDAVSVDNVLDRAMEYSVPVIALVAVGAIALDVVHSLRGCSAKCVSVLSVAGLNSNIA